MWILEGYAEGAGDLNLFPNLRTNIIISFCQWGVLSSWGRYKHIEWIITKSELFWVVKW